MWTAIATHGVYVVWARTDNDCRQVYNVTVGGSPPQTDGGYYDLVSLLRLKGVEWTHGR